MQTVKNTKCTHKNCAARVFQFVARSNTEPHTHNHQKQSTRNDGTSSKPKKETGANNLTHFSLWHPHEGYRTLVNHKNWVEGTEPKKDAKTPIMVIGQATNVPNIVS